MNDEVEKKKIFCNNILIKYIQLCDEVAVVNGKVKEWIMQQMSNRIHPNDEFVSKLKYILSTGIKLIFSLSGRGEFVTYEAYKSSSISGKTKKTVETIDKYSKISKQFGDTAREALKVINSDNAKLETFYDTLIFSSDVINFNALFNSCFKEINCKNYINYNMVKKLAPGMLKKELRNEDVPDHNINYYPTLNSQINEMLSKERSRAMENEVFVAPRRRGFN